MKLFKLLIRKEAELILSDAKFTLWITKGTKRPFRYWGLCIRRTIFYANTYSPQKQGNIAGMKQLITNLSPMGTEHFLDEVGEQGYKPLYKPDSVINVKVPTLGEVYQGKPHLRPKKKLSLREALRRFSEIRRNTER